MLASLKVVYNGSQYGMWYMDSKKYDVFISYRRDGGVDYARMIYLELKGRGYNCFFDYNSLRSGKFNDEIFRAIDECRYFILVLSNGALERCMNEGDWVRREIEFAISKGKDIIPICPSGNVRGFPDVMPRAFEVLRNIQISQLLMDDLFDKSFDKIVEDRFSQDFQKAACDHAGKRKIAEGEYCARRAGLCGCGINLKVNKYAGSAFIPVIELAVEI